MTTPKQYAGLDSIVYDTDSVKLKDPVRIGKFVYENYPKNREWKMKQKKSKGQIIIVVLLILMVLFIGKVSMINKEN